jgi:hypothetical protein
VQDCSALLTRGELVERPEYSQVQNLL